MTTSAEIDGLYVHVPFCDGKCDYCAFYSVPWRADAVDDWLTALRQEYRLAVEQWGPLAPDTVYFGGGTPTLLAAPQLDRLLDLLRGWQGTEWTVEANPGSLTTDKLRLLREAGVNRISLGAQSLNDRVLAFLGRRHTAADIRLAAEAIRKAGFENWGLDLMACVPGVDRSLWQQTLHQALALEPQHVSVYALTSEEGSGLAARITTRAVSLLDDDDQLTMLADAEHRLSQAGFARYEISNYARPGYACRHHQACWRGRNYLGLGCAAASRIGPRRWSNRPDLTGYIQALRTGHLPPRDEETLSAITDAAERLVFGLRMAEGICLEAIIKTTGLTGSPVADTWRSTLGHLAADGLLTYAEGHWRLTARGRDLADHVAVELMP